MFAVEFDDQNEKTGRANQSKPERSSIFDLEGIEIYLKYCPRDVGAMLES